jgi:licheninase
MKKTTAFAFLCASVPVILSAFACSDSDDNADNQSNPSATGGSSNGTSSGTEVGGAGSNVGGTGSVSGGSSSTGTAVASSDDLLIDDFEDGNGNSIVPGGWYGYTDESGGGKSTLTFTGATGSEAVMNGEGFESSKSLEVTYSFDQGTLSIQPYIGLGVSIGKAATPYDLSAYAGVTYTYKGGAHSVRVETSEVTDYDVFVFAVPATTAWKTVTVPFTSFAQEGWGKRVSFEPSHVTAISFSARGTTGQTVKLQLDNLKVVKTIDKGPANMTIKDAAPPADVVLDSLEISNPLQAKAMTYLTRGYNITNWLEEKRFTDFTYDESYVEKLSKAGFKSLRLPVDFDLYVDTKTGTGDSLEITVNDDLFKILDAFDTWTAKYGMSLTIDYHQYSTLLNKADPDSMKTAVLLWGKVAEHFASSAREDLFFELLNEPELSFDGTDPTQAEWTALAEQMSAAIRAKDTTHTLIFGDVNWYGIDKLAARTPLTDTNVVYAFHDYDPFIFTHQGASWANMGSTHDIPYPYDAKRWSQYYSDIGFNTSMESWILSSANNYYINGTHSAVRNSIAKAKAWAVKNNVPVICNEFGALALTSTLEDRARYYTDVVGIFAELAIPWQQWFMIMDKETGTVIPEYVTALQLGK